LKGARAVLRGGGGGNVTFLPDRTSPATAVPAFLPPCYITGVVVANGRLTTDQADVMMVVGNGRWARTAYHGVSVIHLS
jgi:hypothetical protein